MYGLFRCKLNSASQHAPSLQEIIVFYTTLLSWTLISKHAKSKLKCSRQVFVIKILFASCQTDWKIILMVKQSVSNFPSIRFVSVLSDPGGDSLFNRLNPTCIKESTKFFKYIFIGCQKVKTTKDKIKTKIRFSILCQKIVYKN